MYNSDAKRKYCIEKEELIVRATVVRWDTEQNMVLAGDLKCLVYYVISKLNITYLAGDPKRKG